MKKRLMKKKIKQYMDCRSPRKIYKIPDWAVKATMKRDMCSMYKGITWACEQCGECRRRGYMYE